MISKNYDVFISHATDDKLKFVNKLRNKIKIVTEKVWYDNDSISWGESLSAKIDNGLQNCEFGIIVLSPSFFNSSWCDKELQGLYERQKKEGAKILLPIMYKTDIKKIAKKYSYLTDFLILDSKKYSIDEIALIFASELVKRAKGVSDNELIPTSRTQGLIVESRWYNRVPHKIVETQGFDKFNVLVPTDPNYIRPNRTLNLETKEDKYHGIYFLLRENSLMKNVKIESLNVELDNYKKSFNKQCDLYGQLCNKEAFVIYADDLPEGNGIIEIVFSFIINDNKFRQRFNFQATKSLNTFLLNQYNEPEKFS